MVWGKEEKKREEKDPTSTVRDVLVYNINETANETLESTRFDNRLSVYVKWSFLFVCLGVCLFGCPRLLLTNSWIDLP